MSAEFDKTFKIGQKFLYGVNRGPDTENEIHAPGVSTHPRFTRRFGLFNIYMYDSIDLRKNVFYCINFKRRQDINTHLYNSVYY